MYAFNILHANTDPNLLICLWEMLDSFAHAGIAVGYFFMSGLEAVADTLTGLHQVRTLVDHTDADLPLTLQLGPFAGVSLDNLSNFSSPLH